MKALDDVFQLLYRERRRYALYYLKEAGRPVSVDELAEEIAEWESGPSSNTEEHGEFEDVVLTLEHQHLPRAAEAAFIEYEPEESVVRLTGTPAEFDVVLAVSRALERPAGDDVRRLRDFI